MMVTVPTKRTTYKLTSAGHAAEVWVKARERGRKGTERGRQTRGGERRRGEGGNYSLSTVAVPLVVFTPPLPSPPSPSLSKFFTPLG